MKRIIYIFITLLIVFSVFGSVVSNASEVAEGDVSSPSVEEVPGTDDVITEETPVEEEPIVETPAEEPPAIEEDIEDEAIPDPSPEVIPETDAEETEVNFFTRLYEAFVSNKTEVFTLLGSGVLFVLSIILKKDLGAIATKIIEAIARVLTKADVSEEKQTVIIGGLNEMVDGYNEMREQSSTMQEQMTVMHSEFKERLGDLGELVAKSMDTFCTDVKSDLLEFTEQVKDVVDSNEKLDAKVDKFFSIVLSLMDKEIMQNAEVMEVLTSVYENNDALPQGIKNYVALKHAENAKLVAEATNILHNEGGVAIDE